MAETLPDIGDYYDRVAPRYDEVTAATGWHTNDFVHDILASVPEDERGLITTTLDVGAGTGQTLMAVRAALGEQHEPPKTVAVDASRKMLELLAEKFPGDEVTPVHEHVEAYLATHHDQRFNLITAIGACEFMHALPNTLAILAGRLMARGHLMFSYIPLTDGAEPMRDVYSPTAGHFTEYRWPRDEIGDRLQESGLEIVRWETVDAYQRGPQNDRETVAYDLVATRKPGTTSGAAA